MSRDLPAFDSVWIDALVQLGRLSPYQAKVCMAEGPPQLAIGPFVLVSRISSDGRLETFTARQPGQDSLYELTLVHAPSAEHSVILDRLQDAVTRLRTVRSPSIALPSAVRCEQGHLVAAASWVGGKSLAELLIRRGRFPIPVVQDISRQIISSLAQLEQARLLHGDLRLRTVRLDPLGRVYLTQPGLLAALEPNVTIHVDIPADACDGIAPELIDSHAVRSTASELYAYGCLLWQLLAGRPPFPAGDPLVKLAAHQTKRIADIRQWRPDTPASLAELLHSLTHPDPRQRPRSCSDVATGLGRPARRSATTLQSFVRAFQSAAPRITLSSDRSRSPVRITAACLLLLCALLAGSWMHGGVRTELLHLTQPLRAAMQSTGTRQIQPESRPASATTAQAIPSQSTPTPRYRALPSPQHGVVRLDADSLYQASDLSTVGNLTIVGTGSRPSLIFVSDEPLRATGVAVVLQNVALVRATPASHHDSLLEVSAEDFGLVGCLLDGGAAEAAAAALVQWRPLQKSAATGGRIGWVNTVLTGGPAGLACQQAPASVQLRNVLHTASGPLLQLPEAASPRPLPLVLRQVTLRGSGGLISLSVPPDRRPAAITINAERCLFDLARGSALVTLRGIATPNTVREAILACRLTGVESFLQTDSTLALQTIPGVGPQPLDAAAMPIEGLQYSTIRFTSASNSDWRTAVPDPSWVRLAAPRAPGCDLAEFARFPSAPYNGAGLGEVRTVELPPSPAR
ncbi:MAG: protein kinase domain-containing protein [Planctomycetaceae bacterium]